MPPGASADGLSYTVQTGDYSTAKIAEKWSHTPGAAFGPDLVHANPGVVWTKVYVGQKINIPQNWRYADATPGGYNVTPPGGGGGGGGGDYTNPPGPMSPGDYTNPESDDWFSAAKTRGVS